MFIREKIINNQSHAYLVSTRWDKKSKKVKQKVSKYLGKITRLEKVRNTPFLDYFTQYSSLENYIQSNSLKKIILDLVELELYRHGFSKKVGSKYIMLNGEHEIDITNLKKPMALNEGFMHQKTILAIFRYDKLLDEENKIPYKFAALFVNAGVDIDKDLFIELYQKTFSYSL